MRLIDAEALHTLLVKMNDFGELSAKKAIRMVSKAPTVDAEPVRHGKWIITTGKYFGEEVICCSVCGGCKWTLAPYEGLVRSFKYCPNCGAKMDAERKEE